MQNTDLHFNQEIVARKMCACFQTGIFNEISIRSCRLTIMDETLSLSTKFALHPFFTVCGFQRTSAIPKIRVKIPIKPAHRSRRDRVNDVKCETKR